MDIQPKLGSVVNIRFYFRYKSIKWAGRYQPVFFGNFYSELAVGQLGPPKPVGQLFRRLQKFQTPWRRRGAMPKYGRQKLKFLEIAQNHDCGGSTVLSGSPAHQNNLFFEIGWKITK